MNTRYLALNVCLVAALAFVPAFQARQAFDVVSVRANTSGDPPSDPRVSPGRFSWANATLRQLIQVAYDRRPHQIVGMPDWASSFRVDVVATGSPNASPQQMNVMLQAVLADRFNLLAHRDSRDLAVYALMVARRDGRLGPKLHPSVLDCEAIAAKPLTGRDTAQGDYASCIPQMGLTRLKAVGFRMASLASGLNRLFDRTVIDKTGLAGTFDLELSWMPDPTMLPGGVSSPPSVAAGPSIFTALEEQLGLRLVSDRAPVDVLVIDRLERLRSE